MIVGQRKPPLSDSVLKGKKKNLTWRFAAQLLMNHFFPSKFGLIIVPISQTVWYNFQWPNPTFKVIAAWRCQIICCGLLCKADDYKSHVRIAIMDNLNICSLDNISKDFILTDKSKKIKPFEQSLYSAFFSFSISNSWTHINENNGHEEIREQLVLRVSPSANRYITTRKRKCNNFKSKKGIRYTKIIQENGEKVIYLNL